MNKVWVLRKQKMSDDKTITWSKDVRIWTHKPTENDLVSIILANKIQLSKIDLFMLMTVKVAYCNGFYYRLSEEDSNE